MWIEPGKLQLVQQDRKSDRGQETVVGIQYILGSLWVNGGTGVEVIAGQVGVAVTGQADKEWIMDELWHLILSPYLTWNLGTYSKCLWWHWPLLQPCFYLLLKNKFKREYRIKKTFKRRIFNCVGVMYVPSCQRGCKIKVSFFLCHVWEPSPFFYHKHFHPNDKRHFFKHILDLLALSCSSVNNS